MHDAFDYIIVGAGSAGCVLANRLSANPAIRVLVLEAGGSDARWQIRIPAAVRENIRAGSPCNWDFQSEPQRHLDKRRIAHPRGKVLGGSGSINGMVFLRGHPLDYERWSQEGARGWSYREVLPYFKRLETYAERGDDYRGDAGPIDVRKQHALTPLGDAFLAAGREAGFSFTDDANGYRQEGFCRFDMNIAAGTRASSAYACLRPAMSRPNLRVRTLCQVRRISFEAGRATGIEYRRHGQLERVRAEREVILAAGAFGSPHLLMLSGIGPAGALREHGIDVIADLPGVGQNLHDHLEVHVQYETPQPVSLNRYMGRVSRAAIGLRWLLARSGPAAVNQSQVGAFIRTDPRYDHPNVQIHFWAVFFDGWEIPRERYGFRFGVGPMRPTSRGALRLSSADPADHPRIDFDYCSTEEDRLSMRECVNLGRRIASQPAFRPFEPIEVAPGPERASDAEIDAWVRATATTAWHPVGTCRMGDPSDRRTVVDPETRVLGVEGLRVVDASIMPSIVSSNTNAPTMMMAERAADVILGLEPLAASDAPFHVEQ